MVVHNTASRKLRTRTSRCPAIMLSWSCGNFSLRSLSPHIRKPSNEIQCTFSIFSTTTPFLNQASLYTSSTCFLCCRDCSASKSFREELSRCVPHIFRQVPCSSGHGKSRPNPNFSNIFHKKNVLTPLLHRCRPSHQAATEAQNLLAQASKWQIPPQHRSVDQHSQSRQQWMQRPSKVRQKGLVIFHS